jgi:hypothetical protein
MSRHRNFRNIDYNDYLDDDYYEDDYDDYDDDYDENEEDDYYEDEDDYDEYDEVAVKPNKNKGTGGATKKLEKLSVKDKKVYTLDQFQEMNKAKAANTPPPVKKNNNNQGSKVISISVSSSTEKKVRFLKVKKVLTVNLRIQVKLRNRMFQKQLNYKILKL